MTLHQTIILSLTVLPILFILVDINAIFRISKMKYKKIYYPARLVSIFYNSLVLFLAWMLFKIYF